MPDYSNNKIFAKPQPVFSFDSLDENLDPNEALDYVLMYNSELGEMQKVLMTNMDIGGSSSGVSISIAQTGHGLSVGNPVYLNGSTYAKAQADTVVKAEVIGIVDGVTDTDNFTLATAGEVSGLAGLSTGTVYYLSPSSAGAITSTEPSTSTQVSKPVLVATSSSSGIIVNMRGKLIA